MSYGPGPFSTVDAIIEHERDGIRGIVLITRRNPPYGLALPGGFAEPGLTLEENARKEAREETNLDFRIENSGRPLIYDDPRRDPRGHMIAHVYYGTGVGTLRAGDDAKEARLYPHTDVIAMLGTGRFAFDHERIIIDYLRMRGML